MENFKEKWGFPEGFKGIMEVSNTGRIINHNYRGRGLAKEIKPYLHHGYFYISINIQGKPRIIGVHRLVAMAFIPNPENLPFVNHKDENPQNNNVDNLEWCTYQYNNTYGSRIEKMKDKICIPVIQLTKDGDFVARYNSIEEASCLNDLEHRNISVVCSGKRDFAGGYRWRYEDEEKHQKAIEKRIERKETKIKNCTARTKKLSKPVLQFLVNGTFIKEHKSIKEASNNTICSIGSIVDCCKGRIKSIHGYIFKYKDKEK